VRRRLYAVVAVAALGFALPSHAEAPKVLDGKKVTKLEVKSNGGNQQHDVESAATGFGLLGSSSPYKCVAPTACLRYDFVFKPDGITGNVVFRTAWVNRQSDMDLYVYDKAGKEVAHCGAGVGVGEAVSIAGDKLVSGDKYTVIVNYYRSFGDDVTTTVEFPATLAASSYAAGSLVGQGCAQ